jgi:predicted nucleic acid-binding protein
MPTDSGVVLVDTNVLVYAYDTADRTKQDLATDVLTRLAADRIGAVSVQILGEFFVNVTRRITPALTVAEAERSVSNYARSWPVLELTMPIVEEALRGVRRHQFPYWDALIWATAKHHSISIVLSEDFSDGSRVGGVRFLNPFTNSFDLAAITGR